MTSTVLHKCVLSVNDDSVVGMRGLDTLIHSMSHIIAWLDNRHLATMDETNNKHLSRGTRWNTEPKINRSQLTVTTIYTYLTALKELNNEKW